MKYPLAGDLAAKTATHLVTNPAPYTANPPWITKVVADYWSELEGRVPPEWMPKLEDVRAPRGRKIVADVHELGCGGYGCVIPTNDPKVVLKITTDVTEADFAAKHSEQLVAPICVKYYLVLSLDEQHDERPVFMLWRQEAKHPGGAGAVLGPQADAIIDHQQVLGDAAFRAVYERAPQAQVKEIAGRWLRFLEDMARDHRGDQLAPLAQLFAGMAKVYREQGIVFGDVHAGNVGLVDGMWVIIDPGNISVVPKR